MNAWVRTVIAIVRKDVMAELRTRDTILPSAIFTLIVVVAFAFGLNLAPATGRAVAPALLWATAAFAGVLAFGRSFGPERDCGTLDGLLMAPVDPAALYLGKLLGSFCFLLATLVIAVLAFTIMLDVPLFSIGLLPVDILALVGFAAPGTLFAALALSGRARDVLLPILFLPLAIPVILMATGATRVALASAADGNTVRQLAACDMLYVTVAILLFGYSLEE